MCKYRYPVITQRAKLEMAYRYAKLHDIMIDGIFDNRSGDDFMGMSIVTCVREDGLLILHPIP